MVISPRWLMRCSMLRTGVVGLLFDTAGGARRLRELEMCTHRGGRDPKRSLSAGSGYEESHMRTVGRGCRLSRGDRWRGLQGAVAGIGICVRLREMMRQQLP